MSSDQILDESAAAEVNEFNLAVDSDVEETVEVNYSAGQGVSNFSTPAMEEANEGGEDGNAYDYEEFGTAQSTSVEKNGKESVPSRSFTGR